MEETKVIIQNQEKQIFTLPRTVCYIMKYLDLIISVCLLEVKYEFFPLYYIVIAHINHFYPKSILKFLLRGFYNLLI